MSWKVVSGDGQACPGGRGQEHQNLSFPQMGMYQGVCCVGWGGVGGLIKTMAVCLAQSGSEGRGGSRIDIKRRGHPPGSLQRLHSSRAWRNDCGSRSMQSGRLRPPGAAAQSLTPVPDSPAVPCTVCKAQRPQDIHLSALCPGTLSGPSH